MDLPKRPQAPEEIAQRLSKAAIWTKELIDYSRELNSLLLVRWQNYNERRNNIESVHESIANRKAEVEQYLIDREPTSTKRGGSLSNKEKRAQSVETALEDDGEYQRLCQEYESLSDEQAADRLDLVFILNELKVSVIEAKFALTVFQATETSSNA